MDNITTTVHLTDLTGHQTLELTRDETIALVEDQGPNTWVFAQGSMMQPTQLADADWGAIGTVRVTPGLVGGCRGHHQKPARKGPDILPGAARPAASAVRRRFRKTA